MRGGGLTPGVIAPLRATAARRCRATASSASCEPGEGLTVHTIDCPQLAEFEDQEELWRDLQWTPEAERNTVAAPG